MWHRISITAISIIASLFIPFAAKGESVLKSPELQPEIQAAHSLQLRSNVLPWGLGIANIGAEYAIAKKWSVVLDLWFCPWKISDKFSVKTLAILPEGRWWWKSNKKGSYINVHLNVAWYNIRANSYRYQDAETPLIGGGIGYGYRLSIGKRWGIDFEAGIGVSHTKYNRYYNVKNGALKDKRVSFLWGPDRLSIAVTYLLCDL